jgi:FAD/FMN-containing dehydrogenase
VPNKKSIVVDLSEYPGGISVSPDLLTLRAPAGALLKDVKAAAAVHKLHYPPDPNSWDICSFGGSLATNAGGPCACKYGVTRHWVNSIDALMEDGEIHRFGTSSIKDNAGPNLAQLLIGSEGIFGIITAAAVRLMPTPTEKATMLLPVPRWDDLLELPCLLISNGLLPCALEFWDPTILECLRRFGSDDARRLPGEALAILEFDDTGCASDAFMEKVMALLGPASENAQIALDHRQREAVWSVRRQTSVVLKEQFPQKASLDIAVPRSKIKDFFQGVQRMPLPIATYGHLGDGNLHVNLLSPENLTEIEDTVTHLIKLALELGGTMSGEHGIGLAKRSTWLAMTDPWRVQAVRAIKNALDPCGIFNPGKVI